MSYESFDGGSHSVHEWVPVGHEVVPLMEGGGPSKDGKSYFSGRRVDRYYVIRACRLCPEVWWQQYELDPDPESGM